jgi:hypothetical protein
MKKERRKENFQQILISIFVGACVAFLTSLFDGFLTFIRDHGEDIMAGAIAMTVYLAKQYRG